MNVFLNLAFTIAGFFTLVKSVDLFIGSSKKLAHYLRLSSYTISFFLVAIATSLPETMIAITSGIEQNTLLAFGTAMGSNIALLTIITGLPVIISSKLVTRTIINSKDLYFMFLFSLLPIVLSFDKEIGTVDGIVLITAYLFYSIYSLKMAHGIELIKEELEHINLWKNIGLFLVSLVAMTAAGEILVHSAIQISTMTGLGISFIGLTVTAVGTSLPEIAYTIKSIKQGHDADVLGDVLGSVVANSTLVLGIAALLFPISLESAKVGIPTFFFYFLTLLVYVRFAKTKQQFSRNEGFILLMIYGLFFITEIVIQAI